MRNPRADAPWVVEIRPEGATSEGDGLSQLRQKGEASAEGKETRDRRALGKRGVQPKGPVLYFRPLPSETGCIGDNRRALFEPPRILGLDRPRPGKSEREKVRTQAKRFMTVDCPSVLSLSFLAGALRAGFATFCAGFEPDDAEAEAEPLDLSFEIMWPTNFVVNSDLCFLCASVNQWSKMCNS